MAAIEYIGLEPGKVTEALKFYAEAFQAKIVDDQYEDQCVQLKILDSYVIFTPSNAPISPDWFLKLPTDLNSIRRIRQDTRFVEIDQPMYTTDGSVIVKDPFGVSFLLIDKKNMTESVVVDHFALYKRRLFAYAVPSCITPSERCTIKLTALFVTRYGMPFRKALMRVAAPSTDQFGFLELNHSRREFFYSVLELYSSLLKPSKEVDRSNDFMGKALELFFHILQLEKVKMGVRRSVMEVDAFTAGVDYFLYRDLVGHFDALPKPEPRSVMISKLGQTLRTPLSVPFPLWCTIFFVSPEVLGIIKFTAMFAARYGKRIGWEVMEKVGKNPLFSFLDPSDYGFPCYNMVVKAYSKVLENYEIRYETEMVVERYFECLEELKDLDNLYSFVEGVDSLAQMEDEEYYHKMGNREAYVNPLHDRTAVIHHRAHVYPFHDQTSLVQPRPHVDPPFHDETSPAKVQEEVNIEVSVPTMDGRVIIEIRVESFFGEKVSSLKEKIGKVMQIPSENVKLRGKSVGVLRGDKSLTDNNVEVGEILTATWRFSRWEITILE